MRWLLICSHEQYYLSVGNTQWINIIDCEWGMYRQRFNICRTLVGKKKYWSLKFCTSFACRRGSNYNFFLDLTSGFNGLGKDNCKTIREAVKFWDMVRHILEVFWYWLIVREQSGSIQRQSRTRKHLFKQSKRMLNGRTLTNFSDYKGPSSFHYTVLHSNPFSFNYMHSLQTLRIYSMKNVWSPERWIHHHINVWIIFKILLIYHVSHHRTDMWMIFKILLIYHVYFYEYPTCH